MIDHRRSQLSEQICQAVLLRLAALGPLNICGVERPCRCSQSFETDRLERRLGGRQTDTRVITLQELRQYPGRFERQQSQAIDTGIPDLFARAVEPRYELGVVLQSTADRLACNSGAFGSFTLGRAAHEREQRQFLLCGER
jgi:hypothetical protein